MSTFATLRRHLSLRSGLAKIAHLASPPGECGLPIALKFGEFFGFCKVSSLSTCSPTLRLVLQPTGPTEVTAASSHRKRRNRVYSFSAQLRAKLSAYDSAGNCANRRTDLSAIITSGPSCHDITYKGLGSWTSGLQSAKDKPAVWPDNHLSQAYCFSRGKAGEKFRGSGKISPKIVRSRTRMVTPW